MEPNKLRDESPPNVLGVPRGPTGPTHKSGPADEQPEVEKHRAEGLRYPGSLSVDPTEHLAGRRPSSETAASLEAIGVGEQEIEPTSIAEEAKRLHEKWSYRPWEEPSSPRTDVPREPVPTPLPVEMAHSYWTVPPPDPAPTGRRIGWLVVGLGAVAIVSLGAYLAFSGPPIDPNDPGSADVAFFVSPFIAVLAAMAISALLWVVGSLRLADITAHRASRALVAGVLLGPLTYWALLLVMTSAQSGRLDGFVSFVVPTACGIGVTMATAVFSRRRLVA